MIVSYHCSKAMKDFWQHKINILLARLGCLAALLLPSLAFAQPEGGGESGGFLSALSSAGSWIASPLTAVIAELSEWIFNLVAWITSILGDILDYTIEAFILNMSSKIDQIAAIDELWRIIRDLGNMVFIFLILFAAISIILNSKKYNPKDTLIRVVVVALFVNFSLFATQLVIDTSNVFALQIYENISVTGTNLSEGVNISNAIAGQLNLSSVQSDAALDGIFADGDWSNAKLAIFRLIAAAMMGFVGFIMLAFAALITIRFFVLILLMIGSPIAFVAMAIPSINFGKKWWNWLFKQSFFAPAMMLMLYLTLYIGNSMKSGIFDGNNNIAAAITEPSGNIDILIFYAILTGLLLASLIIARRMGAVGADKAIGATSAAYAWTGRQTVGRAGRAIQNNRWLKEKAVDEDASAVSRYLAQKTLKGGQKTAKSSFDVRNTNAVSAIDEKGGALDSSFGQRQGGYSQIREEEQEFLEQQRKDLEELSPEEKERVAKAKAEKKKVEKDIEKTEKDIKSFNQAINDRNKYVNQRDDAAPGSTKEQRAEQRIKTLARTTKEVDVDPSDTVDDLINKLDNLEAVRDQYKANKEIQKDEKDRLDAITKIGQERGEKFKEIMSQQQSVLDNVATGSKKLANYLSNRSGRGDIFSDTESRLTQKTRDYRLFAAQDIDKIDNIGEDKSVSPKRDQRIANNLRGSI